EGELKHGLGVVGDRPVRVDGDGDRAHSQETEGDKAEGEDSRGDHGPDGELLTDDISDAHQGTDHHAADPEGGEIAGGKAGEDVERSAAFAAGDNHFLDMPG